MGGQTLIHSESPMYTVFDKDTMKNVKSCLIFGKTWLCHSKLPHRDDKRHLVQVKDRLLMGTPSGKSFV